MLHKEELSLLIKSKYTVIFVELVKEGYLVSQLKQIASELGLIYYLCSITTVLKRGSKEGAYYQTADQEKMIKTILYLLKSNGTNKVYSS